MRMEYMVRQKPKTHSPFIVLEHAYFTLLYHGFGRAQLCPIRE